jgi:uncharacterized RDD family membrane protein YckC
MILGIKVVDGFGKKLTIEKALLRNASKFIIGTFLTPLTYLLSTIIDSKRNLHDLIANTDVIIDYNSKNIDQ